MSEMPTMTSASHACGSMPLSLPVPTRVYMAAVRCPSRTEPAKSLGSGSDRPMIAALVISRAGAMPRRGFFDLAVALRRFPEGPAQHRAAWQAECAAVRRTLDGA